MNNSDILNEFKFVFINKKTIKYIKLLLISTSLEKLILVLILILIPLMDNLF